MKDPTEMRIVVDAYKLKLTDRLVVLQKERDKLEAKYKLDLSTWRKDMTKWLGEQAKERVAKYDPCEAKTSFRYDFFEGAPEPPRPMPQNPAGEIEATLMQLELTDEKTVLVTTSTIQRVFGDGS